MYLNCSKGGVSICGGGSNDSVALYNRDKQVDVIFPETYKKEGYYAFLDNNTLMYFPDWLIHRSVMHQYDLQTKKFRELTLNHKNKEIDYMHVYFSEGLSGQPFFLGYPEREGKDANFEFYDAHKNTPIKTTTPPKLIENQGTITPLNISTDGFLLHPHDIERQWISREGFPLYIYDFASDAWHISDQVDFHTSHQFNNDHLIGAKIRTEILEVFDVDHITMEQIDIKEPSRLARHAELRSTITHRIAEFFIKLFVRE